MREIITKTTITYTVLHRTDFPVMNMTLEDLLEEADTGHAVAALTHSTQEEVPAAQVPQELRMLGNDGSFFEDDLRTTQ